MVVTVLPAACACVRTQPFLAEDGLDASYSCGSPAGSLSLFQ